MKIENITAALLDSTGAAVHAGDIVEVSGCYHSSKAGLYFVEREPEKGRAWLHGVTKTGELSKSRTCEGWPLVSYSSRRDDARAARLHDKANARLTIRRDVNAYFVRAWFLDEARNADEAAEQYARRGWPEEQARSETSAAFCRATAERLTPWAREPEKAAPAPGPRFHVHGITVDGGKQIPVHYGLGADSVTIYARDYKDLPRRWLPVVNNSDGMTDYFENERATLGADHPLYRFARWAALKAAATGAGCYRADPNAAAELAATKNPGHPGPEDLAAVDAWTAAQEAAAKAAQEAELDAARREAEKLAAAGEEIIRAALDTYPLRPGDPSVTVEWSEAGAFRSWGDGAPVMSIAAAETAFRKLDAMRHASGLGGYDKTKFRIDYTRDGEPCGYTGRYDLGDNDGGIIAHIRALAEYDAKRATTDEAKQSAAARAAVADFLEEYTPGGRVVSVKLAPWLSALLG